MPRTTIKKRGSGKAIIRVFCEGESEQAYADFLKREFSDVAVIKYPKELGLFSEAENRFDKDPQYRDYTDVIDEVWFFFDVEVKDTELWDKRIKTIKKIRRLKRNPNIKVRLLMTTGCIEYWFMLHFKKYSPSIQTTAEKERVLNDLLEEVPKYKKGDYDSTALIAKRHDKAIPNAKSVFSHLLTLGMPCIEESDERNQWLCKHYPTFSNVFESFEYLQSLQKKSAEEKRRNI